MFGFLMQMEFNDQVDALRGALQTKPSSDTGKKTCSGCGLCCWRRPGTLNLDDVKRLSKHLEISEQDFFNSYLVVDRIRGKLCVLPRRKDQEDLAGKLVPQHRTFDIDTPCVFLDEENHCSIHKVKPKGCREMDCWIKDDSDGIKEMSREDILALGWDGLCETEEDD